jgi:hypothetical protein
VLRLRQAGTTDACRRANEAVRAALAIMPRSEATRFGCLTPRLKNIRNLNGWNPGMTTKQAHCVPLVSLQHFR